MIEIMHQPTGIIAISGLILVVILVFILLYHIYKEEKAKLKQRKLISEESDWIEKETKNSNSGQQ